MPAALPTVPGNQNGTCTVANQAVEVTFPNDCTVISILFVTNPGQLSFTPGSDGAPIAGITTPVDADEWFMFRVRAAGKVPSGALPRVFVATAIVPTTFRLIAEED